MAKPQGPIEDDGTKFGYYVAMRERQLGIVLSDEELARRRLSRIKNQERERKEKGLDKNDKSGGKRK